MTFARRLKRSGISLAEVMVVVSILGALYLVVSPRISDVRSKASLRAARQELSSAFASARAAALQKGKLSMVSLTSTGATVTVLSGLNGGAVQVFTVGLDKGLNSSVSAIGGAPLTVSFDARGLITPTPVVEVYKYRLLNGVVADTLCISKAGVILPRTCTM